MSLTSSRGMSCAAIALGMCVASVPAMAGDTNPPPGPIMGTMKTLEEVEPRIDVNALPGDATAVHVISQDGSYKLTADVIGEAGKHGIRIDAGFVTLDLNGFALHGVAGTLSGIKSSWLGMSWIIAKNGSIDGWAGRAIDMAGVPRTHLTDLMVLACAGGGVVTGDSATLSHVMVEDCAGDGITVGADSMVSHSTAINVTGAGLSLGDGSMCLNSMVNGTGTLGLVGLNVKLRDCMIHNSGLDGVTLLGTTAQMVECEIRGSGGDGVVVTAPAGSVTGCVVTGSAGDGILMDGPLEVVDHCTIKGSTQQGVRLTANASGCTISNSTIADSSGNGVLSIADLIYLIRCRIGSSGIDGVVLQGTGGVVEGCTIEGNTGVGLIGTETAAHIRGTTICANAMGIHAQAGATDWTIADCNVSGNAGVGIQIDDSGARITGCHIMGNMGSALLADGPGCEVRDTSITADGVVGAVIVRLGDDATMAECDLDASSCTLVGGWVLEVAGSGVSLRDTTLAATNVSGMVLAWCSGDFDADGVVARVQDCVLTKVIVDVMGDGTSMRNMKVTAAGTTSAPAIFNCTANDLTLEVVIVNCVAGVPIGIDVMGSSCSIDAGAIFKVAAGGTGIRVSGLGASGCTIHNCRISGDGSGPYTGIDVQTMGNVVIANDISVLLGGLAVDNTGGPSNLIGPTINAGNFGAGCDPCGNIVH